MRRPPASSAQLTSSPRIPPQRQQSPPIPRNIHSIPDHPSRSGCSSLPSRPGCSNPKFPPPEKRQNTHHSVAQDTKRPPNSNSPAGDTRARESGTHRVAARQRRAAASLPLRRPRRRCRRRHPLLLRSSAASTRNQRRSRLPQLPQHQPHWIRAPAPPQRSGGRTGGGSGRMRPPRGG